MWLIRSSRSSNISCSHIGSGYLRMIFPWSHLVGRPNWKHIIWHIRASTEKGSLITSDRLCGLLWWESSQHLHAQDAVQIVTNNTDATTRVLLLRWLSPFAFRSGIMSNNPQSRCHHPLICFVQPIAPQPNKVIQSLKPFRTSSIRHYLSFQDIVILYGIYISWKLSSDIISY